MPKNNDITADQIKADLRRARMDINRYGTIDVSRVAVEIAKAEAILLLVESISELRNEIKHVIPAPSHVNEDN